MNQAAQFSGSPWLDDNWRLAWIAPLALALWLGLLGVFAYLLSQTAAPPPQINAVEARIVEIPAPAGLQSSPAPARAPVAPKPVVHRAPPHVVRHVPKRSITPPVPASVEGTAKSVPASERATSAPSSASKAGSGAAQGSAGGVGMGNDSSGARAIYAPTPEIPDELREDAMVAVAIAHFEVGYDGHVQVTLTQPTMNPQLNELLLETLKQWRFAPATRNGVAIASEFDIRIPVTVQ